MPSFRHASSPLSELCQVAGLGQCQRNNKRCFQTGSGRLGIPGDFGLLAKLFAGIRRGTEFLVSAVCTSPFPTHCWAPHIVSASLSGKEWKQRPAVTSSGNLLLSLSDPGFLSRSGTTESPKATVSVMTRLVFQGTGPPEDTPSGSGKKVMEFKNNLSD